MKPERPPTIPPCPGTGGHHEPGDYRAEVRKAATDFPVVYLLRDCLACGAVGTCSVLHITHESPYHWEPEEVAVAR